MAGIGIAHNTKDRLDRRIDRLEDRLDYMTTEYYENNNQAISVEAMRTLDSVIQFLKGQITVDEIGRS